VTRLTGLMTRSSIPAEARNFSITCGQVLGLTQSHTEEVQGSLFPGVKAHLTALQDLVLKLRTCEAMPPLPSYSFTECAFLSLIYVSGKKKNRVPTKYRIQVVLYVASQGALSQIIYIQMYRNTFVESQVPINLFKPCRPLAYGIQLNSAWPRQYRYFRPCYRSVPSFLQLQPLLFYAPFPTCLFHFITLPNKTNAYRFPSPSTVTKTKTTRVYREMLFHLHKLIKTYQGRNHLYKLKGLGRTMHEIGIPVLFNYLNLSYYSNPFKHNL